MSRRTLTMTDQLYDYLVEHSVREPEVLRDLRAETAQLPAAQCQISPEEGQFLAFLVKAIGARQVLELGTFTGYSSLVMALALPDDGQLVACDVSAEWTAAARHYWQRAGVEHKIDLRLAPALVTLDRLAQEGRRQTFDFVFIDADKGNYDRYYEKCLDLVRPGGLLALDNMLRHGRVAEPEGRTGDVQATHDLNVKLHHDERVEVSLVPIADGVTLVRKR